MALDLVGGSLFTLLYDGVKQAMVKTSHFKSLLADLKSTLDSLQPIIIQQIGEHNIELGLPNEEIEDLQRQMEEGVKLVQKFSEFRIWNYCCVGDYTDQLIELDRALRKLLEMLRLQGARDVKEILLLARQIRDNFDEMNRRQIEMHKLLMQQQQKAGDVMEAMDSENNTETVPEPSQGNGIQVAALDGGDALEAVFGILFYAVLEVEDKAVMFKAPLGALKSTLYSLKPLIEELAQRNKVLVRPKEELEKITIQLEKGVELIPKCSKVHPWASCKKSTYTEKLVGLDKFLQGQLYILKMQVVRDVRSTIVSIRNVEMAINQIEESGVLQNQTKGCSVLAEPSPPTLKSDAVLNVEGERDGEQTMISISNTEARVKPIEESGVVQNQLETKGISRICSRKIVSDTSSSAGKIPTFQSKDDHISETSNLRFFSYEESGVLLNQIQTKGWSAVAEPSPPTVGLDVVNEQGTRDVEETTILLRNTEDGSGSVQIEPAAPEQEYRFTGTDVAKVVETVRKPHSFKVHRSMCIELLKLVDRISRIFPDIEAARPRCSTGIKSLCVLNSEIEKAKQLLQYCSESSKLYLALTGNVMVSRCQKSRNLLEQSLCQIQSWVPVILVAEISQIIDDLKGATFKLDPSEEEAGKAVRGLLHQDVSALNSIEDSELKALQLASLRLHITSKKDVLIEKRSIKKLQEKVGDGDPRKKQILRHFFYLLKKYENLILVKQTESASTRQQGLLSSENSGNGFECNQYAEVEPHTGYGDYEAQCSTLNTVVPPEEFMCGISSRVMYDPVVIGSGKTYERMWIQKWFDEGHDTCPKTKVKLAHLSLTPNIAMKESISMWCKKYGVTIPNPSMQPEALDAWENSSTSIFSSLKTDLSTMSFGSLDTSFISYSSRTKTEDGLSLVQIDDDSLKYQYAKKCEKDLKFLSNISELKWDSQCKVVEDVKNYLKCNAQASYSMSSKNFVEPLIKFLRDAHDLDDVKAQRDGFKLLSTFVRKNRKGIVDLCEDTYSLLASYLDSKVTEEVLAIMEFLSGHQDCRCKISSSGALASILKLLNSQIRNIQGKVIEVLYHLSLDREICSEMVSLDCIPKLIPFFEDSALTGTCISILKNLCDTEGARISIAETNGCIASVVEVLDIGTKEEREHAVNILLSLCSQRIEYCHLVMHEGVIPALVHSSANGTERARVCSMEVLRLLRDIDYVHDHESPRSSAVTSLFSEATTSTFSDNDDQSTDGHIMETSNPRLFRFAELKTATGNFSPEGIIGEGSFGNIFRGWVDEKTLAPSKAGTGMIVAIKKLDPEGRLGVREWQFEVYFLGRLSHPNLVKLLGYCCEGNELLLVYEYMQKGSLENHLFIRIPNKEPLSWDKRIKIAIGAARGLAFLHSSVDQVIYRDFKASNILLDRNYDAKISTFGLAKLGPTGGDSHVSTRVMGSYGYAAPEYIATGHLYVESDVYGFGVVLLEILTGLRVVDTKRPQGQHNLVDWAKPLLSDKRKLETVMDVRMEGQYSFEAALKTAHITLKCLASDPKSRPSMKEVVKTLELIQEIKDY